MSEVGIRSAGLFCFFNFFIFHDTPYCLSRPGAINKTRNCFVQQILSKI